MARTISLTKLQRRELVYVISLLETVVISPEDVVGHPLDEASKRRIRSWIERLKAFRREYERRWHLDSEGNVLRDPCCSS